MLFRMLLLSLAGWAAWQAMARFWLQPPPSETKPDPQVHDLRACPACGTWRTQDNHERCGRKDCPF